MTIIIAIDPGLTGALALYATSAPDRIGVYDMPVVDGEIDPHRLSAIIADWKPDRAAIERVGPMPRDGVRQAWRFAGAYTTARVVVALLHISTVLATALHPEEGHEGGRRPCWQGAVPGTGDRDVSVLRCLVCA